MSERFNYQKGEIEIKNTQCDFCSNLGDDIQNGNITKDNCQVIHCQYFPDGIPYEILKAIKRCPHLKIR